MEVLWTSSLALKPAEVLNKIGDRYAYTTVMTVMKRMADKKLLIRKKRGNVYFYQAVKSKCDFASESLDDLFERLFSSYGEHLIPSFKRVAKKLGLPL